MSKTLRYIYLSFTVLIAFSKVSNSQKIPIDSSNWYQQNYTVTGLGRLFDENLSVNGFTGWSKILNNYDAYYPVRDGEEIIIDSIRFYDREGTYTNAPFTVYAINSNWQKKLIATFTGATYKAWVGPNPSRPNVFKLDTTVTDVKYLVFNITDNNFPAEVEFYGSYKPPIATTLPVKTYVPLKNMFGINGFEWDFEDAVRPSVINEKKMNAMKSFRQFRHYMDWEKIEEVEGRYLFNPVARGGWNYDTIYKRCKEEGIEVLADLKTLPPWMIATYPDGQRDWDNNPVRYGKSFTDPFSYLEMARVAFQYVARYGSNPNVDTSLVSVYSIPKWPREPINSKKIGLGLIRYIECDNERDKWWKGRKGYLTGREYAANMSAFYDGHKNTMGKAIGVKNADSTIQVVMAGTAATSTDYLRGMVDWCKEFRGYREDGTVNLCWDIINYHLYSNDASSSQSASSTRGAAPEVSNCANVAKVFLKASHDYAGDMPVWITESGYDINQGSPLKAIAIGNRSALETQADWILRSALLYSRLGLQKCFFYEVYDANAAAAYKFSSSGLINKEDTTRKPAADFLYQTNKLFGDYTFTKTLHSDPIIDKYTKDEELMYMAVIPDEIGRTTEYTIDLGLASFATIYRPVAGSEDMLATTVNTLNGKLTLTVTETPQFIVPANVNFFVKAR